MNNAKTWYHGGKLDLNTVRSWRAFDGKTITPAPIWLTDDRSFAELYARKNNGDVQKVLVDSQKTFPDQDLMHWEGKYYVPTVFGEQLIEDMFSSNMFDLNSGDYDEATELLKSIDRLNYDIIETGDFISWLKRNGYDSAYVRGDGPKNLMVLDPSVLLALPNTLSESLDEQEAQPDDVFGQWLLPNKRNDLPDEAKSETDTPDEVNFALTLGDHYSGEMDNFSKWIPTISSLEKQGKYSAVLSVPDKYKHAYRSMGLDLRQLESLIGKSITPETEKNGSVNSGIMQLKGKAGLGRTSSTSGQRTHYSWTVNPEVFSKIKQDWGSLAPGKDYTVFLRAPIAGNTFLLNPDIASELGIAKNWAYQEEIISVGPVTCDKIIWYKNHNKSIFDITPEDQEQDASNVADGIRNLRL